MPKQKKPPANRKKADEVYRQIRLRVEHLGLHIPGQIIRLDLYRLICHFHSSEYLSKLSDGLDFCPWQELRDEFQNSEIIRILLQTAVMIRLLASVMPTKRGQKGRPLKLRWVSATQARQPNRLRTSSSSRSLQQTSSMHAILCSTATTTVTHTAISSSRESSVTRTSKTDRLERRT